MVGGDQGATTGGGGPGGAGGDAAGTAGELRRRALRLEWVTTAWNSLEVVVTVALGVRARSLALVAFGLDSLVEIFATLIVIGHLGGRLPGPKLHGGRALRLIAGAFWLLAAYLLVSGSRSLAGHARPGHSPAGIAYLAVTAVVMFALAARKRRIATAMGSGPMSHEASMTFLDGGLSVGILAALAVDAGLGWWWADATAAVAVAVLAVREGFEAWRDAAAEAAGAPPG